MVFAPGGPSCQGGRKGGGEKNADKNEKRAESSIG